MDVAQRYVDAFNAGDIEGLRRLMAPSYRYTDRYAGGTIGSAEHLAVIGAVLERMPDRRIIVDRILSSGDTCVVVGTWTATPVGADRLLGTHLIIVMDVVDELVSDATAYYREAELAEA